jgi:mycofactocin system glycosyltransferase
LEKEKKKEFHGPHLPLSYRLRESVHYSENKGFPFLLLPFPLKTVTLHPSWEKALRLLSKGEDISFQQIRDLMFPFPSRKVESFLNDLVRKGFLEPEGVPPLPVVPFVSVIIPVRNRPQEIRDCLQALGQADYPKDKIEIIVVDDASSDNTPQAVTEFSVALIRVKSHKQASYCRNLAAQKAKGDILAFIDSDCMADPHWLRDLVPAFDENCIGIVGGLVDSFSEKKSLDKYEKVRSPLKVNPWFKRSTAEDRFFYVPSCNLLARRDLFLKLGGFREGLHVGEDVDFCWRMQEMGYQIEYRPVGRIFHKHRNRLSHFCSRRFDYGTSEPLLQRLHPKRQKQLRLPLGGTLFWSLAALSILLKSPLGFAFCLMAGFAHSLERWKAMATLGVPLRYRLILRSCMRSYFALVYHCCAFVSRYYLILGLLYPAVPLLGILIVGMHLVNGICDFFIKKPKMGLLRFLFYFTLEQLSYQIGVWWGCIRHRCFRPVNPQLLLHREKP